MTTMEPQRRKEPIRKKIKPKNKQGFWRRRQSKRMSETLGFFKSLDFLKLKVYSNQSPQTRIAQRKGRTVEQHEGKKKINRTNWRRRFAKVRRITEY